MVSVSHVRAIYPQAGTVPMHYSVVTHYWNQLYLMSHSFIQKHLHISVCHAWMCQAAVDVKPVVTIQQLMHSILSLSPRWVRSAEVSVLSQSAVSECSEFHNAVFDRSHWLRLLQELCCVSVRVFYSESISITWLSQSVDSGPCGPVSLWFSLLIVVLWVCDSVCL